MEAVLPLSILWMSVLFVVGVLLLRIAQDDD